MTARLVAPKNLTVTQIKAVELGVNRVVEAFADVNAAVPDRRGREDGIASLEGPPGLTGLKVDTVEIVVVASDENLRPGNRR